MSVERIEGLISINNIKVGDFSVLFIKSFCGQFVGAQLDAKQKNVWLLNYIISQSATNNDNKVS